MFSSSDNSSTAPNSSAGDNGAANGDNQTAPDPAQIVDNSPETPTDGPRPSGSIAFTDVTGEAGIRFRHTSGAFGRKYLPETMGSGGAFLDYDNDGWQDILLVNSKNWPEHRGGRAYLALYHNNGDGTFTNVTREAGLQVELYGMGCAVADYDNDGHVDIYLTAVGPDKLFRNLGNGRFSDVTARTGLGDPGFSTSAAWFDYDNDGKLDLFVCNYVEWTPETDLHCSLDGTNKSYCTPARYRGQSSTLYHNRGNGTFENVTERAGLHDPTSKAMGVALIDYDNNGLMDLFVACDTEPNKLYKNNGNGTFTDVALSAGVAFSDAGTPRAGMGTDAADYDGSGRQSLIVGNFTNESMALYHNEGNELFTDAASRSNIGRMSAQSLTFATFFFDYDLDGLLDIFAANGHVADDISRVQPTARYAQAPHLFRNTGNGRFEEITARVGRALARPVVGRGAAYGDFDRDGDLDLLLTTSNGPVRLFRNDNANQNDLLRVRTVGTRSNRDGIGARVTVRTGNSGSRAASIASMVKTGSSYCSQSEMPLTFGLGRPSGEKILTIEVRWPNGRTETINNVAANQAIVLEEGRGIVAAEPVIFARVRAEQPQPSASPSQQ